MRVSVLAMLASQLAVAQQPVTRTADVRTDPRVLGAYKAEGSFEAGYRFAEPGGDLDLYRASVNYSNGLRVFEGRVRIHSSDGKDRFLDEFSLRTAGGPGDPYQSHSIRAEQNRLYRYAGQYRFVRYHNRLPTLWRGERGLRSERGLQHHDLTLRPGSRFEILLGYDGNRRTGPGFASAGISDPSAGLDNRNFLRFERDLRQATDRYRTGFSARLLGLALTAEQSWDFYEELGTSRDASGLPSLATNIQSVTELSRAEPYRGRTPVTTIALRTRRERKLGFNARFAYSGGSRNSRLFEGVSVLDPASGAAHYRESLIVGDADRRRGSGEVTVVVLPTSRWSLTNTTAYYNSRIDGDAAHLEVGLFRDESVRFRHLGIRQVSNASEVGFRPLENFTVFGAHRFSTRRVRAAQAVQFPDFEFREDLDGTENETHSGGGGIRWLPTRGLRVSFDVEAGRADRPLAPTSERRFHNESARIRWRGKGFSARGYFRRRVNDNPTEMVAYSSASRAGGAHVTWTRDRGLVVDIGYDVLDLDVSTGILNLFDPGPGRPERLRSRYGSEIHAVSFAARLLPAQRFALDLGYSLTKDVVGNRFDPSRGTFSGFTQDGTYLDSGLPMSYHSPQARLSIALREGLNWNLGWQFYGYADRLQEPSGYRAHVGFSSFSIRF